MNFTIFLFYRKNEKTPETLDFTGFSGGVFGVPEVIRTPDLPLRRRSLYPAELRKHLKKSIKLYLQTIAMPIAFHLKAIIIINTHRKGIITEFTWLFNSFCKNFANWCLCRFLICHGTCKPRHIVLWGQSMYSDLQFVNIRVIILWGANNSIGRE